MNRIIWKTGAVFATVGVIAGAFGGQFTHGLRSKPGMTPEKIHAWETASHYAMFNGLGLLAVSLHPRFALHPVAGPAIAVGGALFSGSIFLLTLLSPNAKFLGPVTPLGGSILIVGYCSLLF
ncbi:hypothetical protein CYLTODRAFT_449601 [Cylindrobasidium torrendii FP15055 ss-10]|uniref:DUF423-domain-containing protein n=1 Tax=Cylindrobasidium torrendii FP15055 ss-10 TaxID=1314674 RepID=A0A0D7BQQ1_9AGAR|nr:hypothetical protein CYLTODRAFT_449601 [Cylindrobasidium torrendii FP15055 ss-10]